MLIKDLVLAETLKLDDSVLVELWNAFIEESALYGDDSSIFDLTDPKDCKILSKMGLCGDDLSKVFKVAMDGIRFIQIPYSSDVKSFRNLKDVISGYWDEIFDRIMLYPRAYNFRVRLFDKDDMTCYFDDVVFPFFAEKCGYKIDVYNSSISRVY